MKHTGCPNRLTVCFRKLPAFRLITFKIAMCSLLIASAKCNLNTAPALFLHHVVCNFPDGCRSEGRSEGLYTQNQTLNAPGTRDSVLFPRKWKSNWLLSCGLLKDPGAKLLPLFDMTFIQGLHRWYLHRQVYEYSRWFRNGSHFKMSNKNEIHCTWNYETISLYETTWHDMTWCSVGIIAFFNGSLGCALN